MDVLIKCTCPGTPHEVDTVTFFDRLDFRRATTITKAVEFIETQDPVQRPAEVLAVLSEFYILMGVESWTLTDGSKRLPVSSAAIRARLLDHPDVGILVDAADELYTEQILLPLVERASRSSQPLPTEPSTSVKLAGTRPRRPKPLKQSSTSTTPTEDTERISPLRDGAYSSSQSLELAG